MKKVYLAGLLLLFLFSGFILTYPKVAGADEKMKVIIDRFEGEFAVVELPDRTTANMSVKLLEPGFKEGDIVEIRILQSETQSRKKAMDDLVKDLFE